MPKKTIKNLISAAGRTLKSSSSTPFLDAEILIAHALGQNRTWLYQHPESPPSSAQLQKIQNLIQKRKQGHPVAYLTGQKEFYGLNFLVTPQVLIPRPATELLVEKALPTLQSLPPKSKNLVIDVGTGSGCIAISLAHKLLNTKRRTNSAKSLTVSPTATFSFIAQDQSIGALKIARKNLKKHRLEKIIQLKKANLLANFVQKPGQRSAGTKINDAPGSNQTINHLSSCHNLVITANLPYLSPAQYQKTAPEVKKEPRRALLAEDSGLGLIKELIAQITAIKKQNPQLKIFAFIEFGAGQKRQLEALLKEQKIPFHFFRDLDQCWRVLHFKN